MKKMRNSLQKYTLLVIVITAVLGVLLIAFPGEMLKYAAYLLGGGILLCGVVAVVQYFVKKDSKLPLILGIIAIIFGIIICAFHRQIMSIILFVLGILLLAGGIFDLVHSIEVALAKHRSWVVTVIMSVASIVIGVLSIVNPFDVQNTIVILIGCGFLLFAVLECITYFQVKKINDNEKEKDYNDDAAHEVDFKDAE